MLQQHPSPARLGLTNPTSPSLPTNPNPKPLPPSTTTTTTTSVSHQRVSPSLLPLLPPLPRAEALLHQISSLTPKLLSHPRPPSSLFSSLHSQLLLAVSQLQSILDLHRSASSLSDDIRSLDSTLLSFASKMKDAHSVLDLLLDDYSHYRLPKRARTLDDSPSSAFRSPGLSLDDVLSYAHRISYTTFAPPEFGAGQAPLRGALPPAPQDEQMRASLLYQFAGLDVGAPGAKAEGGDGVTEGLVMIEPTPPPPPSRDAQPGFVVPVGWQKGMPIDLPKDLPPLPAGWKPGDPIQLPPIEGLGGIKGEEQQPAIAPAAAPGMPVVQPRHPETIQVKYVQLDINPDEEYSSDYSSEGSSDEDDDD